MCPVTPLFFSKLVQASVPDDGVEEGPEGSGFFQRLSAGPEAHEGGLDHVFGFAASPENPVGEANQGSPVGFHELSEDSGIVGSEPAHQDGVGVVLLTRFLCRHGFPPAGGRCLE